MTDRTLGGLLAMIRGDTIRVTLEAVAGGVILKIFCAEMGK